MAGRKKTPKDVEAEVLTQSRRRCCICFGLNGDQTEKKGQIAHLDQDRSNDSLDNLAFLCLDHHDAYDSKTSQSKGLALAEVKRYREQLYLAMASVPSGGVESAPSAASPDKPAVAIGGDANNAVVVVGNDNQITVQHPTAPFIPSLHQLRPPPQSFVGRKKEIEALVAATDRGGATIAGLRGLGGIGKTALVLAAADRLKERFPDAQIFLDMKGTSRESLSSAAAMGRVIHSFHPEAKLPESHTQLEGLYRSVLSGKRVLMLADNAAGSDQVRPLTPPVGCCLLVTSRHRFELKGWTAVDLSALPPDEAETLLRNLAPRLTLEEAKELAESCGYLPSALCLAGGALHARPELDVRDYLDQLARAGERLKLLDEYREWTEEERGVAASLELSYGLLPEELQAFWRRLSVFLAGYDVVAAATVTELSTEQAARKLGDLRAYSLVNSDGVGSNRYRLHDLVRDFAAAKLSEEERETVGRNHAGHFLNVLREANQLYEAGGKGLAAGLALFDLERVNIEAGQAWAAARSGGDDAAAKLCSEYPGVGMYCLDLRLHPQKEQIPWLEAALAVAQRLKDRTAEGIHLGNLGHVCMVLGDAHGAIEYSEQALSIYREMGDRRGEGSVLSVLGNAHACLGDVRKAIDSFGQALAIVREIGNRRGEGIALSGLGNIYGFLGDFHKAIESYEQSLSISREIDDRHGEGADLGNLGRAYAALGYARKAIDFYEQALVIDREAGDRRGEGADLSQLGGAYAALGEPRKAITLYGQALAIAREMGDRRGEGSVLDSLGNVHAALDDNSSAIEYYEQALIIARETGNRHGEEVVLGNLCNAHLALGDAPKALALCEQALNIARDIFNPRGVEAALGATGNICILLGDLRSAIDCYEQALAIAREIGDQHGELNALWNIALAYEKLGERTRAVPLAKAALVICERIEDPEAAKVRKWLQEREQGGTTAPCA